MRELLLGKSRNDLPRTAVLDAALRETLDGKGGVRPTVALVELFDRLVRFRNDEVGHGAAGQRSNDFYERMSAALLLGLGELLGRLDVLAGRKLLYVGDVRRLASGDWLVERFSLTGEVMRRLESLEVPPAEAQRLPHPGRLYLADADGTALPALHPLILYEVDSSRVFFLNARRGARKTDYLCYLDGSVVKRDELGDERRELLARVLDIPVDGSAVAAFEAHSQAEESPAVEQRLNRRTVGEFELLSRLGRGGMGVVYRAWQPSLGRQVALKCLLGSGDPKAEARFTREIHALGRVEHPHLVKVFTSGIDGEQWYYAMELVEGADLSVVLEQLATSTAAELDDNSWATALSGARQRQRQQEEALTQSDAVSPPAVASASSAPPPPQAGGTSAGHIAQVVEVVRQAATAAHALHEAGVIHRDIKPGNILLTADGGHAVLMDLGLAQLTDETEGRLTRTRQFVGTLRYASPEQVLAADRLDRRADVYSLGATLWELLTLRPLFGAGAEMSSPDLMLKIQTTDPERPRRWNRRVPADLEAIVLKCLEKDRARRYATAADLAADLGRWQHGEPVQAQPPSLGYLLRKKLYRHRVPVVAAVVVLLAALAGVVFAFVRINTALDNERAAKLTVERQKNDIQAALEKSRAAEQLSLNTIRGVLDDLHELLKDKPALQDVRKKLLQTAEEGLKKVARNGDTAGAIDHESIVIHLELGDIFLNFEGATADARDQYQLAQTLAQTMITTDPANKRAQQDLALCLEKLGDLQMTTGETDAALKSFEKSLEIRKELFAADENNLVAKRNVSISLERMGKIQVALGKKPVALPYYQQSLELRRQLAGVDKESPGVQRDLSIALGHVGTVQLKVGNKQVALECFQEALAICQELAARQKGSPQAQRDLSLAYEQLGNVQMEDEKPSDARDSYQECAKIREGLVAVDKGNARAQRDLSVAYNKVGNAQLELNNTVEALASYKQALDITLQLALVDKSNVQAQLDLFYSYWRLAEAEKKQFEYGKAHKWVVHAQSVVDALLKAGKLPARLKGLDDEVAESLAFCEAADKSIDDLEYALKQQPVKLRNDLLTARIAVWCKRGKHAEVKATADKLCTLPDPFGAPSGQNYYNAACGYALASTCTDADKETKEALAVQAVALLQKAHEEGFFGIKAARENMIKDPDLIALRGRKDFEDFKALFSELKKMRNEK